MRVFHQNKSCLACPHPPLSYGGKREQEGSSHFDKKTLILIGHYGTTLDLKKKGSSKSRICFVSLLDKKMFDRVLKRYHPSKTANLISICCGDISRALLCHHFYCDDF